MTNTKAHIVWHDSEVIRVLHLKKANVELDTYVLLTINSPQFPSMLRDCMVRGFLRELNFEACAGQWGVDEVLDVKPFKGESQNATYNNLNEYADAIRDNDWYGIDYVYYLDPEKSEWAAYSIDEFANNFSIASSAITKRYRVRLYVDVNAESEDTAKLIVHTLLKEGDSQGVLCGISEKDRAMTAAIQHVEYKGEAKKRG